MNPYGPTHLQPAYPARRSAPPPPAPPHKKKHKRRHHRAHGKSAPKGGGVRSDINVTPLVDVVLVLLIIFMVVTPMLHRGVDLELPKTKHHATRQDTGEQLVVSVRGDGVYIEADKVDIEQLPTLLEKELKNNPTRPVNVHADNSLKFGEVRKVLEQVHASGAATVNMETQEKKE
jgi:biopolymer transport protein ExbD/biopolymer transport protein TolR